MKISIIKSLISFNDLERVTRACIAPHLDCSKAVFLHASDRIRLRGFRLSRTQMQDFYLPNFSSHFRIDLKKNTFDF